MVRINSESYAIHIAFLSFTYLLFNKMPVWFDLKLQTISAI